MPPWKTKGIIFNMPFLSYVNLRIWFEDGLEKDVFPKNTPSKFNISPKNDGWKKILSFWGPVTFWGASC